MLKLTFTIGLALMLVSGASAQLNMTFLGNYPYTPDLSDIWGHVDSLGNEYAIVGVQNGISVVDVTTPSSPTEVHFISGPNTIWRDIKVWNKHAYVTNEASGGLKIIDLSNLPDPTFPTVATYSGSSYPFTKAHDLFIDENGVAYIIGSNYSNGGAIMLDLTADPMNPTELGVFDNYYLHDAMARGDTLWGGAINDGFFIAVDVSNKAVPIVLATQNTPNNFTHNCWISDDGNTIFTTDEKSGAYIASYDVSDLSNITELDRIQSNPGSGTIPHNTFFMNNFVITSYYRDGVTVHDVTRPGNMIQTGDYDTYPTGSGNGFNGAWGVYPWLPSGNVIVSDIESGLFILGPNYTRGCYLEGTVTDFNTSNPINNATIEILAGVETTTSDLLGEYAMAILTAGTYSVAFSAPGYTSDTLSAVLSNGVLTVLDAQLVAPVPFVVTGQVVEANGGNPIANADVLITNNDFQYPLTSDGGGNFSISTFFEGTFDVIGGKWLYKTNCGTLFIDSNTGPIIIPLDSGLYDDFSFDFGWGVSGNASSGTWERGEPVGTNYAGVGDANPEEDVSFDCYDQAYITGNGGGSAGNDDVDNGNAIVKSPLFDITTYSEPYVKYHRWFFNDGGSGTPNDTLTVTISNGTVSVVLEEITESSSGNSSWVSRSYKISDYIPATNLMQLTLETADFAGSGHLVEAGLDMFRVEDFAVNISSVNASCNGACDAQAGAMVLGGVTPLSYLWDDPAAQTTDTAVGLCVGTYTATIIDALGDTTTAQVTITQPGALNLSTSTTALCSLSLSDVTVTATNGVAPYSYAWNDPGNQTTQTATSLSVGTYTVTVTDNNACSTSDTVVITEPSALSVSIASSTNVDCNGACTGDATGVVAGGTLPFTYLWDDPSAQTKLLATGLCAGTYTLLVIDSMGCTDNAVSVITEPAALVAGLASSNDVTCNSACDGDATGSASGGSLPYTYLWDDPSAQTNLSASNLCAGLYNFVVTDANGCSDSVATAITEPGALVVSISGSNNASCNGLCDGDATASGAGGVGPYAYSWDDPSAQTLLTANSLCAGTHNVIITDANGCMDTANVTITEPSAIVLTMGGVDATCGVSNGSASVSAAGGAGTYTYLWDDPSAQTTDTASALAAGGYNVTVTDASGCANFGVVSVNNTGAATVSITSITNVTCNGDSNGTATVLASGGAPPYTYAWDDPGAQTNTTAFGLAGGTYVATVTDSAGCVASAIAVVLEPTVLTTSVSSNATSCFGVCDGSATLNASGGTPPYTYVWSPPGCALATCGNLCVGTHLVIVIDSNGCAAIDSVTISEPIILAASAAVTNPSCAGSCDGAATATSSGGTPSYIYSWTDSLGDTIALGSSVAGLCAGSYALTITDGNGCVSSTLFTLTDPAGMTLSFTSAPANCGVSNGAASVSVTNGTAPYSYLWDDSGAQATDTATALAAGTYNVTVTDSSGCTATGSTTVGNSGAPTVSIISTNINCNGICDGSVTATVTGGTAPYTYLWDDPATTTILAATGLCAGTYTVMVTDSNGCVAFDAATISEPPVLAASSAISDVVCVGDSNGSIDLSPTGGVMPYSFNWSDGSTTEDVSNLLAGTYLLVLSDSNGCSIIENLTVGTQSNGSQTSPITGLVAVSQGSNEFYAVAPNTGSVYSWTVVGGTQTGGGQGNNIIVQWDSIGTGQVAVVETDILGCTGDTVFLNVSVATAISSIDDFQMEVIVYPNPNTGQFTVGVNSVWAEQLTVTIYDSKGQQLQVKALQYAAGWHYGNIDLVDVGAGLYYLRLASDRFVLSRKILVH